MPPAGITIAVPSQAPAHEGLNVEKVMVRGLGSLICSERVTMQPLLSVTLTVYNPAHKLVISSDTEVNPVGPDH